MLATRLRMAARALLDAGIEFLLRDEFTTPDAAPIGTAGERTAEPGPGTLTFTENDGTWATSGGVLEYTAQITTTYGDLEAQIGGARTRAAGLNLIVLNDNFTAALEGHWCGWYKISSGVNPTLSANVECHTWFYHTNGMYCRSLGDGDSQENWENSTDYDLAFVLRGSGGFWLIKGGEWAEWTVVWVDNLQSSATVYPMYSVAKGDGTVDSLRIAQLATPWDTDNGIATDIEAGAVAASTTFTHEADCLIEFIVTTVPSADNIDVFFRVQDASNYWIARVTTGGALQLIEVVAADGGTQRGTGGTVTDGERIVIIADDETISGYADNTKAWSYTSAANFKTETAGEVDALGTGGVVSDLITWPRVLSGTALSELESYTGA